MAANSIGMSMAGDIPFVGLCHGVQTTMDLIAGYLGEKKQDINFTAAGINHMAWFLKLEKDGVDLYPKFREMFEKPEYFINDKVRGETMRQFGYFMTESSGHLSEYLPYFRKNQMALDTYCDQPGFGGASGAYYYFCDMLARKYQEVDYLGFEEGDLTPRSAEYCSNILEALETDKIFRFQGNIINRDYISNLPDGCCVEVPMYADRTGMHPVKVGKLPQQLAMLNQMNVSVQLLAAEAAMKGDPELALRRSRRRPAHVGRADAQRDPRYDRGHARRSVHVAATIRGQEPAPHPHYPNAEGVCRASRFRSTLRSPSCIVSASWPTTSLPISAPFQSSPKLKGEPQWRRSFRRRDFLRTAGLVGAGLSQQDARNRPRPLPPATAAARATAAPAAALRAAPVVAATKKGLAAGHDRRPHRFRRRERYQYGPDTPAGRAMLGLQNLPADKKPEKLVVMVTTGADGHWNVPWPTDQSPTSSRSSKKSVASSSRSSASASDDQFTKIVQDTTTKAAGYDVYSFWLPDKGSLARRARSSPSTTSLPSTSRNGRSGTRAAATPFSSSTTTPASASWSTSTATIRAGPTGPTSLKTRPSRRTSRPSTAGICNGPRPGSSSTRSPSSSTGPTRASSAATDLRNPVWSQVHLYQRFCCMADPNQMLFDPNTAKPLIDGAAGIETMQWLADSLKWHSPDALSWGWPEQYANWAAGGAAMTCGYPNITKFLDNPTNKDSKVTGKMKTGLVPGKVINGKLIRRGTWWPNIAQAVSSQSKYPEASYLLAPVGKLALHLHLDDRQPRRLLRSVPAQRLEGPDRGRQLPPLPGGEPAKHDRPLGAVHQHERQQRLHPGVGRQLPGGCGGKKTSAQAVKDAAAEWEKITDRIGRDKQIAALQGQLSSWPTVTDTPTIK